MDTAMIDIRYQGLAEARRVADLAAVYDLNVAPHNFNGHLCTFQSLHLTTALANVRIMEYDVDAPRGAMTSSPTRRRSPAAGCWCRGAQAAGQTCARTSPGATPGAGALRGGEAPAGHGVGRAHPAPSSGARRWPTAAPFEPTRTRLHDLHGGEGVVEGNPQFGPPKMTSTKWSVVVCPAGSGQRHVAAASCWRTVDPGRPGTRSTTTTPPVP